MSDPCQGKQALEHRHFIQLPEYLKLALFIVKRVLLGKFTEFDLLTKICDYSFAYWWENVTKEKPYYIQINVTYLSTDFQTVAQTLPRL